ncbi:hypothetical protein KXQ82_13670 [Mucilaginibacter sp. HMF5004]|uniref:MG2 domain-containing protein n=1 Tax=Mucilaginibacter rivuli TaxID=2857527 RepID=UPI001C5EDEE9|nr:MG2 domain-containing protein [Mucilaginibacter rivuli]MBW4890774.1 hypothetical protein [Mucilaginibacter rivuli]
MYTVAKHFILSIAILLSGYNLFAQQKPGDVKLSFEKVYLHTDRNLYAGGEDIWFKAYLVNAQQNMPGRISNNLYVELIAPDANIIKREIVRLENGFGNGDIKLPDTLTPGKYRLRAYTNWMRNFGDNFVFEKFIDIISNTPAKDVAVAVNTVSQKTPKQKTVIVTNAPVVRFFPEGGALVNGVTSVVAVKAEDATGKGIALSGEIIASSGRIVAKFICDTLGMGSFTLQPDDTQNYTATVTYHKEKTTALLPAPLIKGFVISANTVEQSILVNINCNAFTLQQNAGNNLIVMVKRAGKVYYQDQVRITSNELLLQIPDTQMPQGIVSVTLYDEHSKPLAERLLYIHQPNQTQISLSTDKAVYTVKEKTSVKIKLSDKANANLSVAVVDAGMVPVQADDIASYLLLRSEVRGKIAHPELYFDTNNGNRFKQLDLLLLTQGWRDFVWHRMADTAIRLNYAPEQGFTVSGMVRRKFGKQPIKDMNITLSAFKAVGNKLYTAKTDSAGKYYIDGLNLSGPQTLKLTSRNDKGKRDGWLLLDSLSTEPLPVSKVETTPLIDTGLLAQINKRQADKRAIALKAEGKQLKEVKIIEKKKAIIIPNLEEVGGLITFGYPDEVYDIKPKDLEYKTVEWYLLQNCPEAKQNIDSGLNFLMFGKKIMPYFIVNQKYNPNFPPETILGLGLDKVKKIVVSHYIGPGGADVFVIYLTTPPDAFDSKDFGAEIANVNGYYQARTFFKPLYDGKDDVTKPDYRTTIHWEPTITTDANGEATVSYYNADPKSKIRVIVQGVTDKGVPLSAVAGYEVK